ncbi:hypothetical protein [Candidatus Electronema sp. TJ]|uniref:hypothetical protein n=1 Tax=Candidatus Electronema sp. TJ TaxID=3401573 RepID=UPI003AA80305
MKSFIHNYGRWVSPAASLLLLLFSIWCFSVYAEGKWKDTIKFAKNWMELSVSKQ